MDAKAIWLAAMMVCGLAASVRAQTSQTSTLIDPATLHIGTGWNTSCPTGMTGTSPCTAAYQAGGKGELAGIGDRQLDIYQNSGGATATYDPLLVLAVPYFNTSSSLLGSSALSGATLYPSPSTGTGTKVNVVYGPYFSGSGSPVPQSYGLTASTYTKYSGQQSSGYVGQWSLHDSGSNTNIYSWLGLTGPTDSSNQLGSFLSADQSLFKSQGTPSGFNVYVYGFNTSNFSGNSALNVKFSSKLPVGTFAVAYAQNSKFLYDTPFTQAGIDLPEPGSLSLLGVGMAGLLAAYRRSRRHHNG